MARKRAFIDAAKGTTGTSGLYSQDPDEVAAQQAGAQAPKANGEQRPANTGKPAGNSRPPAGRQSAPDSSGDRAAAGRCSECNAPAGKHTTKCSHFRRPAVSTTPAEPSAPAASADRKALNSRMFRMYELACEASGVESNSEVMREHCAQVLRLVTGDPSIVVRSRADLTEDQLRICAEYFEESGIPPMMPADPGEPAAYDDPFQDE